MLQLKFGGRQMFMKRPRAFMGTSITLHRHSTSKIRKFETSHNVNVPEDFIDRLSQNSGVVELLNKQVYNKQTNNVYEVRKSHGNGSYWGFSYTDAFGRVTSKSLLVNRTEAERKLAETLCFYLSPNLNKDSARTSFPTFIIENDSILRQALEMKENYMPEIEKYFLNRGSYDSAVLLFLTRKYNSHTFQTNSRVLAFKVKEMLSTPSSDKQRQAISNISNFYSAIDRFVNIENTDIYYRINLFKELMKFAPKYDRIAFFTQLYRYLRPDMLSTTAKLRKITWNVINNISFHRHDQENDRAGVFIRTQSEVFDKHYTGNLVLLKMKLKALENEVVVDDINIMDNISLLNMYKSVLQEQSHTFSFDKASILGNTKKGLKASALSKKYFQAIAPTIFSMQNAYGPKNQVKDFSIERYSLDTTLISEENQVVRASDTDVEKAEHLLTLVDNGFNHFHFAKRELFEVVDEFNRFHFKKETFPIEFDMFMRRLDNCLTITQVGPNEIELLETEELKACFLKFVDSILVREYMKYHELRSAFLEYIGIFAPNSINLYLNYMMYPVPDNTTIILSKIGIKDQYTESNALLALRTLFFSLDKDAKAETELRAFIAKEEIDNLEAFLHSAQDELNQEQVIEIVSALKTYFVPLGVEASNFLAFEEMLRNYSFFDGENTRSIMPIAKTRNALNRTILQILKGDEEKLNMFSSCFHSITAEGLVSSFLTLGELSTSSINLSRLGGRLKRLQRTKRPFVYNVPINNLPTEIFEDLGYDQTVFSDGTERTLFFSNIPENMTVPVLEDLLSDCYKKVKLKDLVPENPEHLERFKILEDLQKELENQFHEDVKVLVNTPLTSKNFITMVHKSNSVWNKCDETTKQAVFANELVFIQNELQYAKIDNHKKNFEMIQVQEILNELAVKTTKLKIGDSKESSGNLKGFLDQCKEYIDYISSANWDTATLEATDINISDRENVLKLYFSYSILKLLARSLSQIKAVLEEPKSTQERLPMNYMDVVLQSADKQLMKIIEENGTFMSKKVASSISDVISSYVSFCSPQEEKELVKLSHSLSNRKNVAQVEFEDKNVARSLINPLVQQFGLSIRVRKTANSQTGETIYDRFKMHYPSVFLNLFVNEASDMRVLYISGFPFTLRSGIDLEAFLNSQLPPTTLTSLFSKELRKQGQHTFRKFSDRLILTVTLPSHEDAICLKKYLEKYLPGIVISWQTGKLRSTE